MISGIINDNFEPIINKVSVQLKNGKFEKVKTILDTGFNACICLPKNILMKMNKEKLGIEKYELADGTIIEEIIYKSFIYIDVKKYEVEIISTDSKIALIGMEMLIDKIIKIDMINKLIEIK